MSVLHKNVNYGCSLCSASMEYRNDSNHTTSMAELAAIPTYGNILVHMHHWVLESHVTEYLTVVGSSRCQVDHLYAKSFLRPT